MLRVIMYSKWEYGDYLGVLQQLGVVPPLE